ncbi:MAG: hypothetical protein ACHRHE_16545 [Tepidisphaerales bacterium]
MSGAIRPEHIEVVDDRIAEILRRKGGMHSVRMISSGWCLMRTMIRGQIRRANPERDSRRVEQAVSDRMAHGTT